MPTTFSIETLDRTETTGKRKVPTVRVIFRHEYEGSPSTIADIRHTKLDYKLLQDIQDWMARGYIPVAATQSTNP
jgi:hypothetical protein